MCIISSMTTKRTRIAFSVFLLCCLFISHAPVYAAAISSYDLITAVNSYRIENDLSGLPTNVFLMAAAQNHATYLANTYGANPPDETEGHVGAEGSDATMRAEEAGYTVVTGVQIRENWAGVSSSVTLDELLDEYWGDTGQADILLNPYGVQIGAGVAQVDEVVYYVLNVAVDYASSPNGSTSISATETPEVVPVSVATPQEDGAIIHTVVKGQALWSIAITYGVTVDQLRNLNGLSESDSIYEGQQLYVRAAYTQTPSPLPTNTPMPPTRTPIPPQTPQALKTQEDESLLDSITTSGNREVLGIALIIICSISLGFLLFSMLRKKE